MLRVCRNIQHYAQGTLHEDPGGQDCGYRKVEPDQVITSNPGCFMQLAYGRKRWDQKWGVLHISQILSESLRRGEERK